MPSSFPALATGVVGMHPTTRAKTYATGVLRAVDYSEQRYRKRAPLARFTLNFRSIDRADHDTLHAFFVLMKGSFDSTWSLTLAGVDYDYMVFEDDEFQATEHKPGRYSITLRCRQTRKN